ncbi:MAG: sugar transferase [Desulfocapsaceae bacterium]|nr:sugar transferase [Desulfocapsaceae bacterium]
MGLDAIFVIVAGYSAYYGCTFGYAFGVEPIPEHFTFLASIIGVMFINNYFLGYWGLYGDKAPARLTTVAFSVLKVVLINFIFLSATVFLFQPAYYPRLFLILFSVFTFVYIALFRTLSTLYIVKFAGSGARSRKILIVGDRERGQAVIHALQKQLSWGHDVVGRLCEKTDEEREDSCLGSIDALQAVLREIPVDEVLFALNGDRATNLREYLHICKKMGVSVRILPALWNQGDHSITVEHCQGMPFINLQGESFNANGLLYKRMLDIVGGTAGFLMLLLIFPFVALAIKRDSPGAVFFKQNRKGQHGRIFELYKFRTMYENADEMKKELMSKNEMNGHMFKLENDPRITPVGKWLRKTSLDEFPQFVNVLKGDMSLVGTRPPTIQEVEQYQPEHLKRIAAKPGITGLWQISGRNRIKDFEKVVELDCQYLDNWHFFDDIKILLKTLWVVLRRKGAS